MKTTISTLAVGGTFLVLAAAISGQAVSAPLSQGGQQSALMLAEGGHAALLEHRAELRAQFKDQRMQDESERFVQMLERKPTAAGPEFDREDRESIEEPQYLSPIHRERAEYGWH